MSVTARPCPGAWSAMESTTLRASPVRVHPRLPRRARGEAAVDTILIGRARRGCCAAGSPSTQQRLLLDALRPALADRPLETRDQHHLSRAVQHGGPTSQRAGTPSVGKPASARKGRSRSRLLPDSPPARPTRRRRALRAARPGLRLGLFPPLRFLLRARFRKAARRAARGGICRCGQGLLEVLHT